MKTTNAEWLKALASLKTDKQLGKRFAEIIDDLEIDLDDLETRLGAKGSTAYDELFGSEEWSAQTPVQWLLGAMLATRVTSFVAKSETVKGNLVVKKRRLVAGDLEVTGNLELESELFVLGTLKVGGYSLDTNDKGVAHIVVAGDVSCGTAMLSEGFLMVGGKLTAPLVTLTFNQGFAKILGGVSAKALIEADHGGTRIFGTLQAKALLFDELTVDDEDREPGEPEDLVKLLAAPAKKAIADIDDDMEIATKLAEHVVAGKPLFA
ncbi:MAG: hypothetical protein JWM74_2607 [Myxococcaceae bacterium]|jgi:hypothetical protein|nr:hypothetical protein [Myxococcaceae bacterium]